LDAALRAATEQLERAREKEAQQTDRAAAAALRARFLSDPVRGVRIRAASLLPWFRPPTSRPPTANDFERAAAEFIDAQRFNADRPESRSALGYAMQAPC
jgi:hypothetical protein